MAKRNVGPIAIEGTRRVLFAAGHAGMTAAEIVRAARSTELTVSRVLMHLRAVGYVVSRDEPREVGQGGRNRRRHYITAFAPAPDEPIVAVPMQTRDWYASVCAGSTEHPCGFPPYWHAERRV